MKPSSIYFWKKVLCLYMKFHNGGIISNGPKAIFTVNYYSTHLYITWEKKTLRRTYSICIKHFKISDLIYFRTNHLIHVEACIVICTLYSVTDLSHFLLLGDLCRCDGWYGLHQRGDSRVFVQDEI